ncbi:MAG: HU family DNA-binding protein [Phycisphaerae bacterium]
MRTVTKKELTDRIADTLGAKRTLVKDVVQQFLDEIIGELADGNRLEFRDFGVFEVRTRKPRMAQNPRTLEQVPVPLKSTVKFKAGRRMKRSVQNAGPDEDAGGDRPHKPQVESAAARDAAGPDA